MKFFSRPKLSTIFSSTIKASFKSGLTPLWIPSWSIKSLSLIFLYLLIILYPIRFLVVMTWLGIVFLKDVSIGIMDIDSAVIKYIEEQIQPAII